MPPLSRRDFLRGSAVLAVTGGLRPPLSAQKDEVLKLTAKAVTKGPKHHFFGYYDKTPWDKTGRYLLECTELCGIGHSQMRAPVRVMTQEKFATWLAALPVTKGAS